MLSELIRRLLMLLRRPRRDEELEEEIQAHLRMAEREHAERGETSEEARAAAHREFGNVLLVKETTRDVWGWVWLETLLQDIRYGLRQLLRNPGFTLVAALTLALGIGANTAIFSVADALIWKPLPIPQLGRLVMVMEARQENPSGWIPISPANYLDWKNQNKSFERLSAFLYANLNLSPGGTYQREPERLKGAEVPADFFETLEAKPLLGRTFVPPEEKPGHDEVVILSYQLWQRSFGADPEVPGKIVQLNGRDRMIIGVMPKELRFPLDADLWVPLAMPPDFEHSRFAKALFGVARLKPGVSVVEARTEMAGIARRLAEQFPQSNTGWTTTVFPLRAFLSGDVPSYMMLLLGVVSFVLLIACANVTNLQLVRVTRRSKELALRSALGAGRWRVARLLLAEGLSLSLLGGTLGILAAYWGVNVLRAGLGTDFTADIAGWQNIQIDQRVLVYTLLITILSGWVSGVAPAMMSVKANLLETIKGGEDGHAAGSHRLRLRGVLVAAEAGLAVMLLAGATLMARGLFQVLQSGDIRQAGQVLTFRLSLPEEKYTTDRQVTDFFQSALERLESLPGVRTAALATALPDTGMGSMDFEPITLDRPRGAPNQAPIGIVEAVSPDFFRTLQIPLRSGRTFARQDGAASPRVAMVSDYTAKALWPGENPIGKRLQLGNSSAGLPSFEVVGVAENVQQSALDKQPRLTVYLPYLQWPSRFMQVALRVPGDPLSVASAARERIYSLDPAQPVYAVSTLQQLVQDETAGLRYVALLMAVFGGLAVTLAGVGIYGVMSHNVSLRTHEIGIRMALGARHGDVLALITGQGLRMILLGIIAGIAGAWGVARLLARLFYGIHPSDPISYAGVGLLLTSVAILACYIPARRATQVDPLVALRHE